MFFFIFKSSITLLIFIFVTYYFAKKETLFFKANFIYIYIIFVTFLKIFFNIVFLKIQPLDF